MLSDLWRDLALAVRSLAKARAFTFVCVVSLGIGMAPVIAIPYVSRLTTLTPPGVNTEELVELVTTSVGPRRADRAVVLSGLPGSSRRQYRHDADRLDRRAERNHVSSRRRNEDASVDDVRPGELLQDARRGAGAGRRVRRVSGRPAGAEPVVILSYTFWQNRLGADPDIVGKTLTMDGIPHVVVGVAPDQFGGHLGFCTAGTSSFRSNGIRACSRAPAPSPTRTFAPIARRSG